MIDWAASARRGDTTTYFHGELAREREIVAQMRKNDELVPAEMQTALDAAHDAWMLYERGVVLLTQEKAPEQFAYFYRATKR